jgi:TPR repeat protein
MDDLQVDVATFARMTCCGKAMHIHCDESVLKSKMSEALKSRCPECRQKVPTTLKEEVKQLRLWVDKGKPWAQTNLANKYHFGQGVPQSYEETINYLNMAIKQGDPNAMCDLAIMYAQGQGVAKSLEKAAELYALSANQGHATAQYNLGVSYRDGGGVEQSYEKSIELFTLAAEQGHVGAQFNLGAAYYNGDEGVAKSDAMARKWWLKAALQEQEEAIKNLKMLDDQEGKTTPTLPCCATCGTPKTTKRPLNICTRCRTVRYCNRDCQIKHWKEGGHKRECRRLKAAAAAAAAQKNASLPKKKKEDDSNKEEAASWWHTS